MVSRPTFDRRRFLEVSGAGALAVALGGVATTPVWANPRFPADPFSVGVASGDPLPDGVLLWTRLAPDPVSVDGFGGMPDLTVPVSWEVAEDPDFRRVVRRGAERATRALGHSVHAEVDGLRPGRDYWYRFRAGREISPVGHTRTAPAPTALPASLAFAFVSCQNYPVGYFTALRHLAQDDLDVAFHLGDYIYEGSGTGSLGRAHLPAHETYSLADYRIRYGQYKADPDLMAAHASVAFVAVPDDHEVDNNWAADISQDNDDPAVFLQRRAAAFQAYYENLPLRRSSVPRGPDMQLFRRLRYGQLADFHVLDTRQYRSDQASAGENNEVRWDTERTLLGDRQEQWLIDGMTESTAAWNILAQQSKVAETDDTPGEGESYPDDNWDGYAASRAALFDAVHERGIDSMVIVSGDAHVSMASNLKPRFKEDDSPVVGAEFLGTSISSGGDGSDINQAGIRRLAENPHALFYNARRGYQRCTVTPGELRNEYLVMPSVTTPDAELFTRAIGYVEQGRPGIAQLEDRTIV